MTGKRLVGSIVVLACVIGLLLAVKYDPTHIVPGLLRNEAFFRGYPTGYWREVIGADGRAGEIDINTVLLFKDPDAVPVLLECLSDPDANVRWPSVILLQRAGSAREVEPALRRALDDADLDVRLQALRALGRLGHEAAPAVPRILELSKDDDFSTRISARYALWEIDSERASTAGGWREFTSEKWQFSVTVPGLPEKEVRVIDTPYGQTPMELFGVTHGVAVCMVAVLEYSPENVEDSPLEDRVNESLAEEKAARLGGSLIRCEAIEQHGRSGQEELIELDDGMLNSARAFPVGRRLYQITITYPHRDAVNPKAEEYFLGSLRITHSPEPELDSNLTAP